ncbi:hypothetical protein H0H92_009862 [Tricholoma furcatifolium]|nr:hypothetical protein H0H92_009862 [Tricholoma furcatifolium]
MLRLRAHQKAAAALSSSAPQKNATLMLADEAVGAKVKAALAPWNKDGPDVEADLQVDSLPPSSDPDLSDSCSDVSDVRILPEVTSSSDEDNWESETYSEEVLEGSSSDDECEVVMILTMFSD